jgi:hypothetical protein
MAFEDTGWIELRPITLLFGRNSSGKSAIIRALRLLKQSLDAPGDKGPFIFESLYGVDLGSFTDIVHGGSGERHVWFHFRCTSSDIADALATLTPLALEGDTDPGRTLQLSLGYAAHRQEHANLDPTRVELVDFQIRLGSDDQATATPLFQAALLEPEDAALFGGEDWYAQGLLTQGDKPGTWQGFRCKLDRGFLPELVPPSLNPSHYGSLTTLVNFLEADVTTFLRSIIHLGPIRPEPQRRYSFSSETELAWRGHGWGAFLDFIGGDLKDIQEDINDWIYNLRLGKKAEAHEVGSPSRLRIQFEIGITETGAARPLPISAHGFGLSQVLPIVVQCLAAPSNSVILIEQPELHLHPWAQAALADLFIVAFQRRVWNEWWERACAAMDLGGDAPRPPTSGEIRSAAPRFLLETHSEHLWLRLRRRAAESTRYREDMVGEFNVPIKLRPQNRLWLGLRRRVVESTRPQDDVKRESSAPIGLLPKDLQVLFVVRPEDELDSHPTTICIDEVGDLQPSNIPPEFDSFFADDLKEVAALARAAFGD